MDIIVGISGKIGSGKGTVANYLIKKMPKLKLEEKTFAFKLKQFIAQSCSTSMETQQSHDGKNTMCPVFKKTYGTMQQQVGTALRRYDDNYWVKAMFADHRPGMNWLVSDVRYKNEADSIRERGGILIRINGDPNNVRANSTRDLNHQSEIDLDDYPFFDIVWENRPPIDTLSVLLRQVESLVKLRQKEYRHKFTLKAIVAVDENNGIGKDGKLLVKIRDDIRRFVELTKNNVVIMGRKTYESISYPLSQRHNIVLTKDKRYRADGCTVVNGVRDAIAEAKKYECDAFVIGGAEVYEQFLPHCAELHLTVIHHSFTADSHFPELDVNEWKVISEAHPPIDANNPYFYSYYVLNRK